MKWTPSLLPLFLLAALLLSPLAATAADREPYIISFSDGSRIVDYDWWDEDNLVLYAVNPFGAIVWKHRISTGDREKLISATDLASVLRRKDGWENLSLELSPQRRYVSFYAPQAHPLEPPLFKVVDLEAGRLRAVEFTKVPPDFIIGKYVWDNTDKYVYVAAQPFTSAESEVSLARLSLETGAFLALSIKTQVDLIDELAYSPSDNSIIIVSRSFGGEYPRGEFLSAYSLNDNALVKLYDAYQFRGIEVVPSGEIIAGVVSNVAFGGAGSSPGFLMVDDTFKLPENPREGRDARYYSQVLLFGGEEPEVLLDSQDRGFDFNPRLSPDGRFLSYFRIFYRLPYAVRVRMPENEPFLCLRKRDGVQEYVVAGGVDSYSFSPGSRYVAVRRADQNSLVLFELPR